MKAFTTFLFTSLLFSVTAFSQAQKSNLGSSKTINIGMGIGMGKEVAFNLFTTATFNNNFYVGFHYLATSVHSNGAPEDYINGTHLFTNSTRIPRDHFASYSLIMGKRFQKQKSAFFFSFETGISWIIFSSALFSRERQTPGFFGPQGDFHGYQTSNKTGLLLNGRVGYHISNNFQVELSTYGNINSTRSIIVENLTFVYDLIKTKSKK